MSSGRPGTPWLARGGRRYLVFGLLVLLLALAGAGLLYTHRHPASVVITGLPRAGPPQPPLTPTPTVPATAPCVGPLTSATRPRPNTAYCGGHATSRVVLADGDSWTDGEVSGAVSGSQQGAVQCGRTCTLINMNIHDNPRAFAGIYAPQGSDTAGPMTVIGGRVTGSGSLGIGGGGNPHLVISGVEIDHNGRSANCNFEGGGFKGINHGSRFTNNYVHDNNCVGVWYDINAADNEIDHNRVDNNSGGGIFYEISQDAWIHDNEVSGNGSGDCSWLWGAGIGIASSFNVQVYDNTLRANCNGIAGTQQNRADSTQPPHILANLTIHDNRVAGPGRTGVAVAADNGADLTTRNIVFANNHYSGGLLGCKGACPGGWRTARRALEYLA
ncbi:MAG: right-handed parallel beta-helix repeat-containing protein [Pseudonocardiaceae bacterium]